MILNIILGFCMALADSVPGVSGGTVAFLLGFYDEFINSLNITNPILIGHSFGGRIISLLNNYDLKIKKLLLIDIAGIKPKFNLKLFFKTKLYK